MLPTESLQRQAEPTDRLLVVSGSCSPVTGVQIEWALKHGYAGIRVPSSLLLGNETEASQTKLLEEAERFLREGKSVILYTALGPADESIAQTRDYLRSKGLDSVASGELLGARLGQMARELVLSTGLQRIVCAGGDTSGFAVKQMDLFALEIMAGIVPGGPLCRAYSNDAKLDGLEIVLKGGQVGPPDFFERVRKGRSEGQLDTPSMDGKQGFYEQ
ncbi:hypothetical protein L0M14_11030 [Paenibacillus hexagrammi]|uniref:Four-carbon acid sugar kinase nucleotide binding domain-containing protein n=2 Tax=Paenibacillus hexagrammi TaxID=2908839 RepID=A0ABY3SQW3_9BACL|nr:hypothetical protein L0M14_11030 [Paenibacillus sp. YPD9-1]